MKKTISLIVIAVFIVLICAAAQAGGNKAEAATPDPAAAEAPVMPGICSVDVYTGMQSDDLRTLLYTFKETAQIQIFKDAVDHAERLPGQADIAPSDYTAVLHYENNDTKLYLWAGESYASFMYANAAGTLYKVDPDYAAKLCELLLTGGKPDDSLALEAENDIVSVKVFGAGSNGAILYTFTELSDTLVFYSAMKHAEKLSGIPSMMSPDYRLDITDSSGSREVMLWLGKTSASLQYRDNSHELYRVRSDDALELRALFDEYIAPIEEIEELRYTSDIDLILKYPAPDMAVQPMEEGFGCWTVENRDALDALLSNAGGKAELMLPSDDNLTLEKAVLYDCSHITARYHDGSTGNTVIYSATNGNIDFYPWEMGWKKAGINGYTCYKAVLDRHGLKATLVYLQHNGWTVIGQMIGDADKSDVERCMKLDTYSWNDDMPPMEQGGLLIKGNENIENVISAAGGASFEQHHNSYYECVRTSNPDNLGRFLSERLGFSEYYYYDGSEEDMPLDRVNVEYDGERVTFLLGDVNGDEYKAFSYTAGGCPSVPGGMNITALPEEIKDFGSVTLDGVTYYYSVAQNYKKYITNVTWEKDGIRFSIDTRTSRMQPVNAEVISEWVSHVTQVPLG